MICQDKSVGEPLAARFCVMKDTEPFGGSSAVFLPTLTLSCHEIDFSRGQRTLAYH